jgi:ketosteroid isomerase-like protein
MTEAETLAFADRFMAALESGDVEAARAFYAPDAAIWHNNDNRDQDVDRNLRSLDWFARKLPRRHYRVTHREALKHGFLQQHVLEATLPDGTPWSLLACVVITMKDGVITRLEEYLDSAQTTALASLGR